MLFRQLEYFTALAREQHFTRAAASCHVSQPALSESLRRLEHEFGVPLVRRGSNYEGLTPEGERLLGWAARILADRDAMQHEVGEMRTGLTGQLRIAVIPAATASVAGILARFCARQPLVEVRVDSGLTSAEVLSRVRAFDVDAGIVFSDAVEVSDVRVTPVYEERHVLVLPPALVLDTSRSIGWADLAELPMCLLRKGMRGRDLLDEAAATHDVTLRPRIETDSVTTLLALVRTGQWASIVPRSRVPEGHESLGLHTVELHGPPLGGVALISTAREPAPILATALADSLRIS